MTNLDWSPLDEDRNPVRGDPFATQDLATHFTERAGIINDVMAGLGRLSRDDQEATGLDELLRIRDELVPDLRLVEERYEQAAGALRPYCSALEDAQRMARDALDQATMAQDQIRRAQAGVEEMEAHERAANLPVIMPAGAPPPPPEPWAGPDWRQTVDDEEGNLEAARRLRDEAVALWEEAAGLAANRIGDAANDDLENEGGGLFGAIGDAISGAAQWVADNWPSLEEWSKILGAAAAVCGLLSLIPIPGFQVFGALALGIGALKLGIDTYLWATGRQGFGEVGMGLIGLATFGVGRAALAGA
ncbi:MAG: putative T7SS-secreted protein, partial [Acidimicrobiia bacterium]